MKQLKVGVIGVGHLGQHHARLYRDFPHTTLVGVVDVDHNRAAVIGNRYGVPAFVDPGELLPKIQAVSVAVPTSDHFVVVKQCLEAGLHVLVEKPLAMTTQESRTLLDVAKERGLILQVGHVERFNPVIIALGPHIQFPEWLESHRLSPFQTRGLDVNVVLDLMVHDIDLVLSFQDSPVQSIEASGGMVLSDQLDVAHARIAFENGSLALLSASRVSPGRVRTFNLLQQHAYFTVDLDTRQALRFSRQPDLNPPCPPEVEHIQGSDEEPLRLELEAFVHAVQNHLRPLVSGEEGMASIELAERIVEVIHTRAAYSACHR